MKQQQDLQDSCQLPEGKNDKPSEDDEKTKNHPINLWTNSMTCEIDKKLETLFSVPIYLPYVNDDIEDQTIEMAETKLNVKLPDSYIKTIRKQNGGYLRYELPDYSNSMIFGIGKSFTSILDDRFFDYQDEEFIKENGKKMIPIDGDGHWYLCLDYRNGDVPVVSHLELEGDVGAFVVADSFDEYLKLLRPPFRENSFYITEDVEIEGFIKDLGRVMELNTALEPDSFSHGYTYHRAIKEHSNGKSWIFFTPNKVPFSFVRDDEYKYNPSRYDRLMRKYSGHANRLVDNDDVTWEIEFDGQLTEEIRKAVQLLRISGRWARKLVDNPL